MAVIKHITDMPSGKHSGRRSRTQLAVLHSAECPLRRGYAQSLTNWSNTGTVQASWHTFAGPGTIVRAVNSYMAAWHASVANPLSIGAEQAGYAAYTRDVWLSKDGRDMIERLAMEWAEDCALFGIELRWLETWEVRAVLNGNTSITGLCTHRQVDPASRTDPGDNYPYEYLLERIKHHSGALLQSGTVTPLEDEMPTPADLWNHPLEVRGKTVTALDTLKWANEFAAQARADSRAALNAVTGLLSTQIPIPGKDGETATVAALIVWANRFAAEAAGNSAQVLEEIDPEVLAQAVAAASADANAQAVADKLTVSVKQEETS